MVTLDDIKIYDENFKEIPLVTTKIAWEKMIGNKFKSLDKTKEWVDVENERFINWMMPSTYPSTIKGWFRLGDSAESIPAGNYTFQVTNNLDAQLFNGEKYFGFEEYDHFGAKNLWLVLILSLVAIFSFTFTCVFYILSKKEANILKTYSRAAISGDPEATF